MGINLFINNATHNYLCQCSLNTVAGNDGAVALVCTPTLEQLSRQTTLHHAGARHHHGWPNVFKVFDTLFGRNIIQVRISQ